MSPAWIIPWLPAPARRTSLRSPIALPPIKRKPKRLLDPGEEPAPADPGALAPRPPDEHRLALHVGGRDPAPGAAVRGVVSVVAHREQEPRKHCAFEVPVGAGRGAVEAVALESRLGPGL